jgi:predicted dehydrogenase
MSIGSHCILQMLRLIGPAATVRRAELRFASGNEVEDAGTAEFELAGGGAASLAFDWGAADQPQMRVTVEVEGTAGSLRVNETALEVRRGNAVERTHVSRLPDPAPFFLGGDGYALEDAEFMSAAINGTEPEVGWREGFEVQRVLDAIYRSAESGGPARLE